MANEKNDQHLSEKDLADCFYEIPSRPEIRVHLEDCATCQKAYADLQTHLGLMAADYERQAMEGLDPYFFTRETQAIMARVRAARVGPSFLVTRWQWFAATAVLLIALAMGLTMYHSQRQYDQLWSEAHAVVAAVGPVPSSPGEFTAVFDDSDASPGLPVEPESQVSAEPFGSD